MPVCQAPGPRCFPTSATAVSRPPTRTTSRTCSRAPGPPRPTSRPSSPSTCRPGSPAGRSARSSCRWGPGTSTGASWRSSRTSARTGSTRWTTRTAARRSSSRPTTTPTTPRSRGGAAPRRRDRGRLPALPDAVTLGREQTDSAVGPLPLTCVLAAATYDLAVGVLDVAPPGDVPLPLTDAAVGALVDVTAGLAARQGLEVTFLVRTPNTAWATATDAEGSWTTVRLEGSGLPDTGWPTVEGTEADVLDAASGRRQPVPMLVNRRLRLRDVPGPARRRARARRRPVAPRRCGAAGGGPRRRAHRPGVLPLRGARRALSPAAAAPRAQFVTSAAARWSARLTQSTETAPPSSRTATCAVLSTRNRCHGGAVEPDEHGDEELAEVLVGHQGHDVVRAVRRAQVGEEPARPGQREHVVRLEPAGPRRDRVDARPGDGGRADLLQRRERRALARAGGCGSPGRSGGCRRPRAGPAAGRRAARAPRRAAARSARPGSSGSSTGGWAGTAPGPGGARRRAPRPAGARAR